MKPTIIAALALSIFLVQPPGDAAAQAAPECAPMLERMPIEDRVSPYDSTSVSLGAGAVKICYGRPSALGRTLVGGEIHPFGDPWRLGANEPTTLHTNIPIQFGDVPLDPGSYSLYAVPGAESWEIVVNASYDRWGIPISGAVRQEDIGSVTVPRERPSAHVETLTLEFGPAMQGSASLLIQWEDFRITVPVTARSS